MTEWRLLPWFVLRQAGFPVEWLDELSCPAASAAADAVLDSHEPLLAARRTALDAIRDLTRRGDQACARSLERVRRAVERGGEVPAARIDALPPAAADDVAEWNRRLADHERRREELREAADRAGTGGAARLRHRFRSERWLREALLLSNEPTFDLLDSWLQGDDAGPRARVDVLARYLQRLCAKNETSSHFGPLAVGSVDVRPGTDGIAWDSEAPLGRRAFATHWAAALLAARMSADGVLRDHVRPCRAPFTMLDGDRVLRLELPVSGAGAALSVRELGGLSEVERDVLRACDGTRTIRELRELRRVDPAGLDGVLASLAVRGALDVRLEVPAGLPDPLAELRSRLPAGDPDAARWHDALRRLEEGVARFADAPGLSARRRVFAELKEDVRRLTGASPERGRGQSMVDRSVLFEECARPLRGLRMGAALAAAITGELAAYFDLLLAAPRLRLARERELLGRWFGKRFGEGRRAPLARFLEAFARDAASLEPGYAAVDAAVDDLRAAIDAALLPDDRAVRRVAVDGDRLRALLGARVPPLPAVCNPDVMLISESAARLAAGGYRLVVGDCHATRDLLSHSPIALFLAEAFPAFPAAVVGLYQRVVEPDEVVVDVIRSHRNKVSTQVLLPCPDLEAGGRSPKGPRRALRLEDLVVRHSPRGLRLEAAGLGLRPMTPAFLGPAVRRNPMAVFCFPRHTHGYPVRGGGRDHLPRLELGRAVLQRELWRVPAEAFSLAALDRHLRPAGSEDASHLVARRIRRAAGMPRHCFAVIPGEPKPLYVDFEAPLLTRQLVLMARRAAGPIELSEMLPGPGELWLRGADGTHTAEVRCLVASPAAGR